MPAPERTSLADITDAARRILESSGTDAVTMSAVANAVGIRPPSLYKRVEDRNGLLRLIADDAAAELVTAFRTVTDAEPRDRLVGYARAFRHFAATAPRAASLLFAPPSEAARGDGTLPGEIMELLLDPLRALGHTDPLPAARTLTAWVYGFTVLEHAGAFRSGGDVDEAFTFGLSQVIPAP